MDLDGSRLQNTEVVVPDTGGTQPCIKCPQCLGLQLEFGESDTSTSLTEFKRGSCKRINFCCGL